MSFVFPTSVDGVPVEEVVVSTGTLGAAIANHVNKDLIAQNKIIRFKLTANISGPEFHVNGEAWKTDDRRYIEITCDTSWADQARTARIGDDMPGRVLSNTAATDPSIFYMTGVVHVKISRLKLRSLSKGFFMFAGARLTFDNVYANTDLMVTDGVNDGNMFITARNSYFVTTGEFGLPFLAMASGTGTVEGCYFQSFHANAVGNIVRFGFGSVKNSVVLAAGGTVAAVNIILGSGSVGGIATSRAELVTNDYNTANTNLGRNTLSIAAGTHFVGPVMTAGVSDFRMKADSTLKATGLDISTLTTPSAQDALYGIRPAGFGTPGGFDPNATSAALVPAIAVSAATMTGQTLNSNGTVNLRGDAAGLVEIRILPQPSGTARGPYAATLAADKLSWTFTRDDIPAGSWKLEAKAIANNSSATALSNQFEIDALTGSPTLPPPGLDISASVDDSTRGAVAPTNVTVDANNQAQFTVSTKTLAGPVVVTFTDGTRTKKLNVTVT